MVKYLKGELSGKEMNSVERHLSTCEMCSDTLEGLSLLLQPEQINTIVDHLNARIDSKLNREKYLGWISSPIRIAASILIIVSIVSLIYYTSTLTSPTNTLSENIIIEEESPVIEPDSNITAPEVASETPITKQEKAYEKGASPSPKADTETIIIADDVALDFDVLMEEKTEKETVAEAAAGAQTPTQAREKSAKATPSEKIVVAIVENDIELNETIALESNDKSKKLALSHIEFSDEEEEVEEEEIFTIVEEMPSFINNEYKDFRDYIAKNLKYPAIAAENGIQGQVYVSFIVEPDGSLSNVKIVRGVDETLDQEAIRVIKSSPLWNPGTQRGKPVRVTYTFPVKFVLE